MKPVSAQLLALLTTRQFYAADLWEVVLVGGTTLRFCSGDADITANGNLFSAGGQVGPYWDRTGQKAKCHWGVGTSVDTLTVDVLPGSSLVGTIPFLQAVRWGIFDGAEVTLWRAMMPTYGDTSAGVVKFFVGRVAEVIAGRSVCTFSINSHAELLNQNFPRNLAQVPCMNNLGDTACGVNRNSYKTTGTLTGTPTANGFTATLGGTFSAGTFDGGSAIFTSGAFNNWQMTVKSCGLVGTTATVLLAGYMPGAPSAGDTINLFYGCNKSLTDANGCPKFTNTGRYRGMKFTPQPSTAI